MPAGKPQSTGMSQFHNIINTTKNLTKLCRLMGALSNSSRKTANMAGFYKGIQSAGAAVFWALDGAGVSYRILYGLTVSFTGTLHENSILANHEGFSLASAQFPSFLPHLSSGFESRILLISRRI